MARLKGKKLAQRLRSARSLLDARSKKNFGRGKMDTKNERFISTDGAWCLQYRYRVDGSMGSDGAVFVERVR